MAYEGGIDFLELPLGGVEWPESEIHSPWRIKDPRGYHTSDHGAGMELRAIARKFDVKAFSRSEFMIVYDIPQTEGIPLACIVMGMRVEDGRPSNAWRHFVLFITPKATEAGVYERVGVGFMPGTFIDMSIQEESNLIRVR
jgi:hypothetical protein